jgi:hypothetical protein
VEIGTVLQPLTQVVGQLCRKEGIAKGYLILPVPTLSSKSLSLMGIHSIVPAASVDDI